MPSASPRFHAASRFARWIACAGVLTLALQPTLVSRARAQDQPTPPSQEPTSPSPQPPASQPPAQQPANPPTTSRPQQTPPRTTPPTQEPKKYYADMWTPRTTTGAIHLHGGLFAPSSTGNKSTTLGARVGVNMGSHLLLGLLGDWSFKSKKLLQPTGAGLPGFEPNIVLARVDAHLLPVMTFLQVELTEKFFIVPYAGIGLGYEWLVLFAKDYQTAQTSSARFGNWAWQSYGGVGIRLSPKLNLDGEVFYNGANVARNTVDTNGATWKEIVDVNGVGGRIGLLIVY